MFKIATSRNKVVSTDLSVTYSVEKESTWYVVKRNATKSYSIEFLDEKSAMILANRRVSMYTRPYSVIVPSDDDSMPSTRYINNCLAKVSPRLDRGPVWKVNVQVDEVDYKVSSSEPADPAALFTFENARDYDEEDDVEKTVTIESATSDGSTATISYDSNFGDDVICQRYNESTGSWQQIFVQAAEGKIVIPNGTVADGDRVRVISGDTKSDPVVVIWGFNGLCFTAEEAGSTISMTANRSAPSVNIMYRLGERGTWTRFNVGSTTVTLQNVGDKAYFVSGGTGNQRMASGTGNFNYFVMTGRIAASGNVNSLLSANYESIVSLAGRDYCFYYLFYNCSALTSAPSLPATTIESWCYSNMFMNCTSLTAAPALPAESAAERCYYYMFYGCNALVSAPALPAMTLANECYMAMFLGCSSLAAAPSLPALELQDSCYKEMFYNCTSMTAAPDELPAASAAGSCYNLMFAGCSALVSAPALPATSLASACYYQMFKGCASLVSAPELPAETLSADCYSEMFSGCTSLASAPELPATSLVQNCYYEMFYGCSSLEVSPRIRATSLASYCCYQMFYGCSALNDISIAYVGAFSSLSSREFSSWVYGVAEYGTFRYNGSDRSTAGFSAIPYRWTVVPYEED
jgi:hypothetical protein